VDKKKKKKKPWEGGGPPWLEDYLIVAIYIKKTSLRKI
jgi:hypothetical protein